jgi:hypothetical protein
MSLTETASDFYDVADFATSASYTPVGSGTAVPVLGIFDTDYVEPFGDVEARQIAFRAPQSAFAAKPAKGATLAIGSTTYRIKNVQDVPPAAFEWRLMLEKV